MNQNRPPDPMLRAARKARERNRAYRKALDKKDPLGALSFAQPEAPPLHYHLVYHVPKDNIVIPHFRVAYATHRDAMIRLYEVGQEAEPQTEWYDNGMIGIETTMPGRVGLWWVQIEAAGCVAKLCRPDEMIGSVIDVGPGTNVTPILRIVEPE